MEERRGARIVTQRHLEVEPAPAPPASPPSPPPESPPAPPSPARSPSQPLEPSGAGLIERQLRWYRERAKFESSCEGREDSA